MLLVTEVVHQMVQVSSMEAVRVAKVEAARPRTTSKPPSTAMLQLATTKVAAIKTKNNKKNIISSSSRGLLNCIIWCLITHRKIMPD